MSKPTDTNAAKVKRQKKIVIGGVVLLVAVLAFEGPKTLKGLHNKPVTDRTAAGPTSQDTSGGGSTTTTGSTGTSTTAAGTAGSTATPSAAPLATATPGASKLPPDPDPAPALQEGQLVSFSLFKTRDPFVQQLGSETAPSGGGSTSGGSGGGSTPTTGPAPTSPPPSTPPSTTPPTATPTTPTTPAPTTPTTTTPAPTPPAPPVTPPPATTPPATTPPAAAPSSATISINGVSEKVKVGDAFPVANPVFRLVAIKDGVAQVGIAGGSLQGGSDTVPLEKGKTVTLMNTADGTRYVLKLVSVA